MPKRFDAHGGDGMHETTTAPTADRTRLGMTKESIRRFVALRSTFVELNLLTYFLFDASLYIVLMYLSTALTFVSRSANSDCVSSSLSSSAWLSRVLKTKCDA